MFGSFAKNLFGSSNDRVVKAMQPLVQQINSREADLVDLDDEPTDEGEKSVSSSATADFTCVIR